jgi:hypothetical protein
MKQYAALSLKPNISVKLWQRSVLDRQEGTDYMLSWLIRINSEKRLLASSCLFIRQSASLSVCFRMTPTGRIYVQSDIGGL